MAADEKRLGGRPGTAAEDKQGRVHTMKLRLGLRAWLLLVAALAACAPPEGQHQPSSFTALTDDVDEYVLAEMNKRDIPGLALGVLKDGELIKAKGYGLASMALDTPVTPETVFVLTSVTKQFTATGIMLLVQDGRLGLDDGITKYLAEVPGSWGAITVRHLLTHTSGLTDRLWYGTRKERWSVFNEPPDVELGERWEYSDLGYVLLGVIIEKVSGKPYREFLANRIFVPLDMTATATVGDYATRYRLRDGELRRAEWPPAEGGIISNVVDLAKWEAALLAEKILDRSSLDQMWTPVQLNDGSYHDYGFGWTLGAVRGHRIIGHGGGAGHYYFRLPDEKLTVIVLTNLEIVDGSSPLSIAQGIARRYAPDVWPSLSTLTVEPDKDPQLTEKIREALRHIVSGVADSPYLTPEFNAALHPNSRIFIAPKWFTEQDMSSVTFIACEETREREIVRRGTRVVRICHYRLVHPVETRYFSALLTADDMVAGLRSSTE